MAQVVTNTTAWVVEVKLYRPVTVKFSVRVEESVSVVGDVVLLLRLP